MYCHHCQWEFSVPETSVGTVVECPHCAARITVENRTMVLPCPECKTSLRVDLWMIGEQAECPSCHKEIKLHCVSTPPETQIGFREEYHKPIPGASCAKGEVLGKYQICRCLGIGGMGEVYLARHTVMETFCALKLLKPEVAARNRVLPERLIREAKIAAQLQHPNIITVFDACIDRENNRSYIVMEYVDGMTVEDMLKKGPIPEEQVLEIAKNVTSALVAASRIGIVHRDIKPANIMITKQGMIKLADLGIAKGDADIAGVTLTQENAVLGTPNYASPEQLRSSHSVDARADVYSLGATMYHMLTGTMPFAGDTVFNVMAKVLEETLPPLGKCGRNISPMTRDLVERMLAKDPKDRPPNAVELLRELRSIDPQNITVSGKVKKLQKKRKKQREEKQQNGSLQKNVSSFLRTVAVLPALALLFLAVKISYNFYQDQEAEKAKNLTFARGVIFDIVDKNNFENLVAFANKYRGPSRRKAYHYLAREAIRQQNIPLLEQMLKQKLVPPVSQLAEIDFTAVIAAVGNPDILQLFLENGMPVSYRDNSGRTPLMKTAANHEMVKLLLEKAKDDVNAKDISGKTALFYALPNPDSLKYLLDAGADINMRDQEGGTILFNNFLHLQPPEHLKFLVNSGLDLEAKNKQNQTALEYACQFYRTAWAKALLEAGAKVTPKCKELIERNRNFPAWKEIAALVDGKSSQKNSTPSRTVSSAVPFKENAEFEQLSKLNQEPEKKAPPSLPQTSQIRSRSLDERLQYALEQYKSIPELQQQAAKIKNRKNREKRLAFLKKRQNFLDRQIQQLQRLTKIRDQWDKTPKPSYDQTAGREFQRRILEYTTRKRHWGYDGRDYREAKDIAEYFQKHNIDPDIEVTDGSHARYNGPLVKLLASGRIPAVEHFIPAWLERHPKLDNSILFTYSTNSVLTMLLTQPFDNIDSISRRDGSDTLLLRQFNFPTVSVLTVKKLLLSGANPDLSSPYGYNPLTLAIHKKPELVQELLAAGADPNIVDRFGRTPAAYAVITGNFSVIQPLLAAGADADIKDKRGLKPLDYKNQGLFSIALQKGQHSKVQELISKDNVSVNMPMKDGLTPLQYACRENNFQMVRILLEAKADVNYSEAIGSFRKDSPLQIAFGKLPKSLSVFQTLIHHGANTAVPPSGYGGCTLLSQMLTQHGFYLHRTAKMTEPLRQHIIRLLLSRFSQLTSRQQTQCFNHALHPGSEMFLPQMWLNRSGWQADASALDTAVRNKCSANTIRWLLSIGLKPTQTTVNQASSDEIRNMLKNRLPR